ncbi:hypothetical protein D9M73_74780 [compost metagenome]
MLEIDGFFLGDLRQIGVAREAAVEEGGQADAGNVLFEIGIAERADILARGALRQIVEQRALEDKGVRRVDDHQPRDARRVLQRRHPRDRPAPIMADQREGGEAEMIGKREQIGDHLVGGIIGHLRWLGRTRETALVGRDDEMVGAELRDDVPPRAVRFGEAVEQEDRRMRRVARRRHVERDAGREGDGGE